MRTALLLGCFISLSVAAGCSPPSSADAESGSATGNIEQGDCAPLLNGTVYQSAFQAQGAWPSRGLAVEASFRGMSYPATTDTTNGMYVIKLASDVTGIGTFSVFVEQPTGAATLSTRVFAACRGTSVMDVYLGQDETGAWSITGTQAPL